MYIIKNAFKCIGRSRGRNILIGVIVFVIAVSACIGLSIRQAAENAKSETLEGLTITATIYFDRQKAMNDMISGDKNSDSSEGGRPSFDRDKFAGFMGESSSLTLDEYKKYAEAESVKDFYYSVSASFNGNDDFLPVSNDASSGDDTSATTESNRGPNGFFQPPDDKRSQMMGAQSDFTVVGYSSESAMTAFIDGTATIVDGAVFTEGTTDAILKRLISTNFAANISV